MRPVFESLTNVLGFGFRTRVRLILPRRTSGGHKSYEPEPTYSAEWVANFATLPFGGADFTS